MAEQLVKRKQRGSDQRLSRGRIYAAALLCRHLLLLLSLLLNLPAPLCAEKNAVPWKALGEDLELARFSLWPQSMFSPEILFIRTSLRKYRPAVVRSAAFGLRNDSVKSLSKASRALIGINASFFDEHGKALGLIVSRGNLHQRVHKGGQTLTGVFQVTAAGVQIIHRRAFVSEKAIEALQAGPRLIVGERPLTELRETDAYSRRAGVCIDTQGRLLLYISSGFIGVTLKQVQELLVQASCSAALNLDGGGSAQLYVSKDLPGAAEDIREIEVHGSDNVPVILGLFLRD